MKNKYVTQAKTHFCVNFHNYKTLALIGDTNVKYANVVSGDEGMNTMLTIPGSPRVGFEHLFMILKNQYSNFSTRGFADGVSGVCYKTGPKG